MKFLNMKEYEANVARDKNLFLAGAILVSKRSTVKSKKWARETIKK